MASTATDIIRGALVDLTYVGAGETIDSDEMTDFFESLKTLVDGFPNRRLGMHEMLRHVHPLIALSASYTIGIGGEISVPRPEFIDAAGLILDTSLPAQNRHEAPIQVYADGDWQETAQKQRRSSHPAGIWYDYAFTAGGLGHIHVHPVPSGANMSLVLYLPQVAVEQFADLNTTSYTWAPGAQRMLRKRLAVELAPMCGMRVSRELERMARRAEDEFYERGIRPTVLTMPSLTGVGRAGASRFTRGFR